MELVIVCIHMLHHVFSKLVDILLNLLMSVTFYSIKFPFSNSTYKTYLMPPVFTFDITKWKLYMGVRLHKWTSPFFLFSSLVWCLLTCRFVIITYWCRHMLTSYKQVYALLKGDSESLKYTVCGLSVSSL